MIGIILIGLFTLKMGGPVSTFLVGKYCCCMKSESDLEKAEKEEKKQYEKQFKSFEYLSILESRIVWANDLNLYVNKDHQNTFYRIDHFGTVPTPPPDVIV